MGNREALLEAAKRCLYTKGYMRTTARDVAATAGVSLAAIGYHYRSLEALLDLALIEATAGLGRRVGAYPGRSRSRTGRAPGAVRGDLDAGARVVCAGTGRCGQPTSKWWRRSTTCRSCARCSPRRRRARETAWQCCSNRSTARSTSRRRGQWGRSTRRC